MLRLSPLLLLGIALISVQPVTAADTQTVRLYIFTAGQPTDGSFSPPDLQDREDTVRDMRRRVDFMKAANLKIKQVQTRDEADVLVEVISRERNVANSEMRFINLRVTSRGTSFTLQGIDDDGKWTDAAGDGLKRIAAWIDHNRAVILAAPKP